MEFEAVQLVKITCRKLSPETQLCSALMQGSGGRAIEWTEGGKPGECRIPKGKWRVFQKRARPPVSNDVEKLN